MIDVKELAIRKAQQSLCRYRVSAIGFNAKNEVIGITSNKPRFPREHGSIHAEMALIKRYGKRLKKIAICRINAKGNLLLLHPCSVCARTAESLGIKIVNLEGEKLQWLEKS